MTDPILNVAAVSKRFGPTVALDRGDPGGRGCRADGRERRGEVDPREDSQRRLSSRCRRALVARAAVPPNVTTRRQTVGYCDRASIDADAVVPTLSIADNLLLDRVCDPASPWRVPPVVRRQTAAPSSSQVRMVKYGAREQHAALGAIGRFEIRCTGPDDRLNRLSGGNQQKVVVATTGLVRRHAGNHAHD
jgi:hypothetical protein